MPHTRFTLPLTPFLTALCTTLLATAQNPQFIAPTTGDDTHMIQNALNSLQDDGELVLLPGVYTLSDRVTAPSGLRNITIRSSAGHAIMKYVHFDKSQAAQTWQAGIAIDNCRGLHVKGLDFQCDPPLFTEAQITAVSMSSPSTGMTSFEIIALADAADFPNSQPAWSPEPLHIDAFMPFFGTGHDLEGSAFEPGIIWDRALLRNVTTESRRVSSSHTELRVKFSGIPSSAWAVHSLGATANLLTQSTAHGMTVHVTFVHVFHEMWRAPAIRTDGSSDVVVSDCRASGLAVALRANAASRITIERLQVAPLRPGKYVSLSRGATNGLYGINGHVRFVDCNFEGCLDDAIDITSHVWSLATSANQAASGHIVLSPPTSGSGSAQFSPGSWGSLDTRAGSPISVFSPDLTAQRSLNTITGSSPIQPGQIRIDYHAIHHSAPVVAGDAVSLPGYRTIEASVRGCHITGGRGAGILASADHVIIEDNTIRNTSGPGIRAIAIFDRSIDLLRHAGQIESAVISGNNVRNCNPLGDLGSLWPIRAQIYWNQSPAAIEVGAYYTVWDTTNSGPFHLQRVSAPWHGSVAVIRNQIDGFDRSAISVNSVRKTLILGNSFGPGFCRAHGHIGGIFAAERLTLPVYPATGSFASQDESCLIRLSHCTHAEVSYNSLDQSRATRPASILPVKSSGVGTLSQAGNSF